MRWLLIAVFAASAAWTGVRPSNDRVWSPDQAVLPRVSVRDGEVRVLNIRDARYRTPSDYDVRHYDASFRLDELESVWFAVEPLGRLAAHTFLSFGFRDGRYLAVSAEIRKEKGERYSPLKGLLKRYELMYVLADERDVLDLRARARAHEVRLYRIHATTEQRRALLLDVAARAERLASAPEFYHTLTNACTTNIVRHVNRIAPGTVPLDLRFVLPAEADRLAHELGLLGPGPFEPLRRAATIDAARLPPQDDPAYSKKLRAL